MSLGLWLIVIGAGVAVSTVWRIHLVLREEDVSKTLFHRRQLRQKRRALSLILVLSAWTIILGVIVLLWQGIGWWLTILGGAFTIIAIVGAWGNNLRARAGDKSPAEGFESHLAYGLILVLSLWTVLIGIVVFLWYQWR